MLRIFTLVKFRTLLGWSRTLEAIIDTGAYTTLLPVSVWETLDIQVLGDYFVQGLVPRRECTLPVKIGLVTAVIFDDRGNISPEMQLHCFLGLTDETPLVIGFKDLLEKFALHIDTPNQEAFLEYAT
ncbi:MAG TPA: hypothetical protein VKK79_04735 [Candidatus Lokiarchaeia archaeon]|nr:hypothetical protein [Candidatus Lokiarchaeia archaeon]